MGTGYRLERGGPRCARRARLQRRCLDLPQVAVEPLRPDDVLEPLGLPRPCEGRCRVQRPAAVDDELSDARDVRQLSLVTVQSPYFQDTDSLRRDRPQITVAPDAFRAV